MPINGIVAETIQDELRHYPGVEVELTNGGKHDRAVFRFQGQSRFMTLPKTPSDHRAPKNMRRDLKKTLGELGVERSPRHVGVGSRGGKGRRSRSAPAAIALNSNYLSVLIPGYSKLISHFKAEDGTAKAHWQFEIRSSADLKAPPLIAIKRAKLPDGKERMPGFTRGTMHRSGGWLLSVMRGQVPALTRMVDSISSVDVKVYSETKDEIVFQLPAGVIPTTYQPHHDDLPSRVRPEAKEEEPTEPQTAKAPPVPQPAPVAPVAPVAPFPTALRLELPREQSMTIERAIRYLNKQKLGLGNKLRFTVNEGGTLSAVHRIE
jgi:hypothetical protein